MQLKRTKMKWLISALWITIGAVAITLLVAAVRKKDTQHCADVAINIKGASNDFFVDKSDVLSIITHEVGGNPVGKTIGVFNLKTIEAALQKNSWIKKAQLFIDNNQVMQVNIFEREPVARIFSTSGNSFYIDNDMAILPLCNKYATRVPIFTNFPSDKTTLSKTDSALLKDILVISSAIQKDSFQMAMIDQVDITAQKTFQLIPKIGTQIILLGDATDVTEKLNKLKLFYKEAMTKVGWAYYGTINLQFKNQVVAKRRGAEDVVSDSLRAFQLMQLIAANAEKQSADSMQLMLPDNDSNVADTSILLQSVEHDDDSDETADNTDNTPAAAIAKAIIVSKPVVTKIATVKKVTVAPTLKTNATPHKPIVKLATAKPLQQKLKQAEIVKPKPKIIKVATSIIKPKPKPIVKSGIINKNKPLVVPKKPPAKSKNDY